MTRQRSASFGFRLATRLARREVLRRPGRTVLVAMLVAVPVGGMLVADAMVRTQHKTLIQYWHGQYGTADAIVSYTNAPPAGSSRIATLLAQSRVVPGSSYFEARVLRTVGFRRSNLVIASLPMTDRLARGIVQLQSGRAPTGHNEVFLTRTAARQLGVGAGDTLRLTRPNRRTLVVTGVGEIANDWDLPEMVLPADADYPFTRVPSGPEGKTYLVDLPASVSQAELKKLAVGHEAANWGFLVSPALVPQRTDPYTANDAETKVRWSWVLGALVLTVAGIVIAAAFAVGARRQLVTLGQLAANGAPQSMLRRVLFLQGTLTGITGALLGFGLGAGALAVLAPHVDRIFGEDLQPYTLRLSDLIPIFVLGVVTATIAALLPARTTSRIPVLAALAGRRPLGRVPRWLPIAGGCVAMGGLAVLGLAVLGANGQSSGYSRGSWQVWALTAVVGGVAVLLGACAIAPSYVSVLEPVATRARGSSRLAIRSLARQRTRSGAVVSAIAATAALAIAASALLLSSHANDHQTQYMRSDEVVISGTSEAAGNTAPPAALVAAEQKVLPGSTKFQLVVPAQKDTSWEVAKIVPQPQFTNDLQPPGNFTAVIADRTALAAYRLSKQHQRALTARGALLLGAWNGRAVINLVTHVAPNATPPPPRHVVAALVDGRGYPTVLLPSLLLTAETARRLGTTTQPSTVVLRARKDLSTEQRNHIADISAEAFDGAGNEGQSASVNYFTPRGGVDPLLIQGVLLAIALAFVLFVVAVNLALSATETRDERDVMSIVGASPGAMRIANGYKATLLTVMGMMLAIPVGFLPVVVFIAADKRDLPVIFPWQIVSVLVVALPVVVGLLTTAASGLALRLRPVRISTMAYD